MNRLGVKAAQQLRLAHGGRVPLEAWAAALLSHIITGAATSGLNQDVPEPYRSTGIDELLDRELITTMRHGYRPSDGVIFSLGLDRGRRLVNITKVINHSDGES